MGPRGTTDWAVALPTVAPMTAMTRGPLSARVYWTRRILVLAVALGLVAAAVQLVSMAVGGSSGDPDRAAQVVAEPNESVTPDPDATEPAAEPKGDGKPKQDKKRKRDRDRGPVLAEPEGTCTDRDIAVTPTAKKTVAGSPVTFVLELRTILTPACTWEVSPQSLTVKITSGKDNIWFSNQCRRAIPRQDVVIRNNVSTEVEVTWSARRSDQDCSRLTEWALPGWYFIEAAALAGEPSDLQFQLTVPKPEVVIETVDPEPKGDQGKKNGKKNGKKKNDGKKKDREGRSGARG